MNTSEQKKGTTERTGLVTMQGKLLFGILCLVALVSFAAGTRINELNDGLSRIIGVPRSSEKIDLASVQRTYQYLVEHYDGKLDSQSLIEGANKGLVSAIGDDYTVYLTAEEAEELQDSLDGEIGGGIGAEIGMRNDTPTVVRVLPDNPAARSGVQKGDKILRVNDEDVSNKDVDSVVAKIRGKEGTTVKLEVLRGEKSKVFTITRAIVDNPSVQSEVRNDIGILTITRFDGKTGSLARKAAEQFKEQNVQGVILDLRGDGGGYIEGAIDIASLWLERGELVVSQKKNGVVVDTAKAEGNPVLGSIETVVLIDEGSASASEIVAGALRDHGEAALVGTKTYGKGSVQQLIELGGGSQLKVTVAKWYTPKGSNINGNGLKPDVQVAISEEDINRDRDPQLDAALRELK